MKKLQGLGKALSKEEQKKITGGRIAVCTCNGSPNMETVVCACVGFIQCAQCTLSAASYCQGLGYSGTSCDYD